MSAWDEKNENLHYLGTDWRLVRHAAHMKLGVECWSFERRGTLSFDHIRVFSMPLNEAKHVAEVTIKLRGIRA